MKGFIILIFAVVIGLFVIGSIFPKPSQCERDVRELSLQLSAQPQDRERLTLSLIKTMCQGTIVR